MVNARVARILHEIADALLIKGENPFRIRSYRAAAETLESLDRDVADMVRRGQDLTALAGIGAGMESRIREIVETGTCADHAEVFAEVPPALLELLKVHGLGHRGVGLLWRSLGIASAEDLERAIADGRFRTVKGMKAGKEAQIVKGLAALRR